MARYSRSQSVGNGSNMTKALGRMVGLLLSLYVFDKVLAAIVPVINTSVYFASAVTFTTSLFPVVGILGAFEIIYGALKGANLV